MASETLPIVRPRSASGTIVMTVVMSSGIMMAVPVACTMRPTRMTPKFGAIAASNVPSANEIMAAAKTARRSKRCSIQPVVGMTTAIVSMNAVESHCAACAVTWSDDMSCGIALTMIVSLRMTMKVATVRMRSTSL